MSRILARPRPLVSSALLGMLAALSATAPAARAQAPVTVNFNSLVDTAGVGVRYVDNCYQESGFQVTAVGVACGTPYSFATGGPTETAIWTGSPALFLNDPTATEVDFGRVGGGSFSMQSIDFASFYGADEAITLVGSLAGGGTVMQTFSFLGTASGLQTLTLNGFAGLTSVRVTALDSFREPIVLFDNIAVTATPEPATIALVAGGLLGLGTAARRRRRTARVRA
ncbi:MAG TPA: PEP-CTERM sorting domain-containing protein [Gemmatirosa sp.]